MQPPSNRYQGLSLPSPPACGCLDIVCYTDYFQTVTCILETWTLYPNTLTLAW